MDVLCLEEFQHFGLSLLAPSLPCARCSPTFVCSNGFTGKALRRFYFTPESVVLITVRTGVFAHCASAF